MQPAIDRFDMGRWGEPHPHAAPGCETCCGRGWRIAAMYSSYVPPGTLVVERCDSCHVFHDDPNVIPAAVCAGLSVFPFEALRVACVVDHPENRALFEDYGWPNGQARYWKKVSLTGPACKGRCAQLLREVIDCAELNQQDLEPDTQALLQQARDWLSSHGLPAIEPPMKHELADTPARSVATGQRPSTLEFSLSEQDGAAVSANATGRVAHCNGVVEILLDGYGCQGMQPGAAGVVMLELYRGDPRILVWGDINDDDVTCIASLADARETLADDAPETLPRSARPASEAMKVDRVIGSQ